MSKVSSITGNVNISNIPSQGTQLQQSTLYQPTPIIDNVSVVSKYTGIPVEELEPLRFAKFKSGRLLLGENMQDIIEVIGILRTIGKKQITDKNLINYNINQKYILNLLTQGVDKKELCINKLTMYNEFLEHEFNLDREQAEFVSLSGYKCPKCHSENTTATVIQTRAGDESGQASIQCNSCNTKTKI
ncbi:MAG: hypothetical protein ACXWE7_13985 [Nitrososphaeraceae archaeon]